MPLLALTIYWQWSLMGHTNHCHKSTELTFFDNSLLKEKKNYLKILIERPMVRATSGMNGLPYLSPNLKSILVFVIHLPGLLPATDHVRDSACTKNPKYPLRCPEWWLLKALHEYILFAALKKILSLCIRAYRDLRLLPVIQGLKLYLCSYV